MKNTIIKTNIRHPLNQKIMTTTFDVKRMGLAFGLTGGITLSGLHVGNVYLGIVEQ